LSRRREVRRGEKVPATVGTVADGLVESELSVFDGQRPVFDCHGAEPATGGAGLLGGQALGLLLQEGGQSPLGQAAGGGGGDLLHGLEVDGPVGAGLAEGATRDDFAPLGSDFTDFLELLGGELGAGHGESYLVLTKSDTRVFLFPFLYTSRCFAKGVLASPPAAWRLAA
jgi:hypothetical protein